MPARTTSLSRRLAVITGCLLAAFVVVTPALAAIGWKLSQRGHSTGFGNYITLTSHQIAHPAGFAVSAKTTASAQVQVTGLVSCSVGPKLVNFSPSLKFWANGIKHALRLPHVGANQVCWVSVIGAQTGDGGFYFSLWKR